MRRMKSGSTGWPAWLIAFGFGALVFTSGSGLLWAHAHADHASSMAQYVGLWPSMLGVSLGLVGIVLALGPIRRGETWAIVTAAFAMLLIGVPRLAMDSRCFANIATQHGCHTFLGGFVAVLVGSVAAIAIRLELQANNWR
jgi:hypothetical protein